MYFLQLFRALLACIVVSTTFIGMQAMADPVVTYSWTTTNQGYGNHVDQPSLAKFDVSLAKVQSGSFSMFDVSNIQLAYPGLSLATGTVSSLGTTIAYVDATTGAPVFHDDGQGFALFATGVGQDIFNYTTFFSILFDASNYANAVVDQFNAFNNGTPWAGYPTAGYWKASFPDVPDNNVPEPGSLALLGLGMLGLVALRRRKTCVTKRGPTITDPALKPAPSTPAAPDSSL